jgi:hypothetical protein
LFHLQLVVLAVAPVVVDVVAQVSCLPSSPCLGVGDVSMRADGLIVGGDLAKLWPRLIR